MTSSDSSRAAPLADRHAHLRKTTRQTASLLLLVCLTIIGLSVWQLAEEYVEQQRQHEKDLSTLSSILLQGSEASFTHASTILLGLVERLEHHGGQPEALAHIRRSAIEQVRRFPEMQGIFLYDRDGSVVVSSQEQQPLLNAADRGYFQQHQLSQDMAAHIGRPIRSRTTNDWIITVSHRINDPDGQFAGVALLTLSLEAFLERFRAVDLGDHGVINLMRRDGAILVRQPFIESELFLDLSGGPVSRQVLGGRQSGVLRYDSPVDGTRRVVAFHASQQWPIYVLVGLGERQALGAWWDAVFRTVGVMMAALIAIVWLGLRTLLGIRERLIVESSLLQAHRDLSDLNASYDVLASEDELTGLASRRQFDHALNQTFLRVSHDPLSLILLELDGFSHFRDSYGQQEADNCLRQVSGLVRGQLRRSLDLPARFASEELAVILPGTDAPGALTVAENIRRAIEEAGMVNRGSAGGVLTVSVGVASCVPWQQCKAPDTLLQEAGQALSDARQAGRNRVAQRVLY